MLNCGAAIVGCPPRYLLERAGGEGETIVASESLDATSVASGSICLAVSAIRGVPSYRQKRRFSSSKVRLHVGQRFMIARSFSLTLLIHRKHDDYNIEDNDDGINYDRQTAGDDSGNCLRSSANAFRIFLHLRQRDGAQNNRGYPREWSETSYANDSYDHRGSRQAVALWLSV